MKNIKKDMKDTLRYKNMVANLKSRPAYYQEAMLVKEISRGVQWRMDAVMDAIERADNWHAVNSMSLIKHAAMFGRLKTIERFSKACGFDKHASKMSAAREVIDGFHMAVIHGHYRVADFFHALGAKPSYRPDTVRPALGVALTERNTRKLEYLFSKEEKPSEFASYALYLAVSTSKPVQEIVSYLVAKGADPLKQFEQGGWSALSSAVKYGHTELVNAILVAKPDLSVLDNGYEMVFNAIGQKNLPMAKQLLSCGVRSNRLVLSHVLADGNLEAAELLMPPAGSDFGYGRNYSMLFAAQAPNAPDMLALCEKHGMRAEIALQALRDQVNSWEKFSSEDEMVAALETYIASKPRSAPKTGCAPKP